MSRLSKIFIFGGVLVALLVGGVVIYNLQTNNEGSSADSERKTEPVADDTQPILQNLGGIQLAAYAASTGRAGNIEFSRDDLNPSAGLEMPVFLFGQELPRQSEDEPQRLNPNFEFGGIAEPIDLVAAMDGVVAFVKYQPESDDSEVFLSLTENSQWVIGYDHVSGVTVKQGDTVRVGQKLGQAAKYKSSYRYELQINNESAGTMHCPVNLLDQSVRQIYSDQLDQFTQDWDEWYGSSVYPNHDGGCLKPSLSVSESEGR